MKETDLRQAFARLKPGSKAAQVRAVMPMIEEQLAKEVSHAEIVGALNKVGVDVTLKNFEAILYRYRKKRNCSKRQDHDISTAQPSLALSEQTKAESADEEDTGGQEGASNAPDRDAFERSLDPVERDKYADRFMGRRRPFGGKRMG